MPDAAPPPPSVTLVASVELSEPNACTIHVTAIAAEFAKRGHRTTLVAPQPLGGAAAIDASVHGVEVRFSPSARPLRLPNSAGFFLLLPELIRVLMQRRGDILYSRAGALSFVVVALARLLRRSHVISEHNGWLSGELLTLGARPAVAWLAQRAQLLDARLADQVVVVSDVVGEHFQRAGLPIDKLLVVGNGTDTDRLHPVDREESLARWGFVAEHHYLGFLGTLAAWQGVAQAVEALPLLVERDPTIFLVIGGDGPERESLVRLARRLGVEDHVIFTGYVPIPDANSLLNCFDVAIAPKTAGIAALGMSPLKLRDYAAAGRPVAAPDVPGFREHAEGGWLALYDPEDPAALVATVAALMGDPERRRVMGASARRYAERHFGWSHSADVIAARLPSATPGWTRVTSG